MTISYITIFLLSPKDITDYSVADTEYWRETDNRLLLKTLYDYNNKQNIESFPRILGEWTSFDYKYPDYVYDKLNAEILLSRGYKRDNGDVIWIDFINSKTGESFHKQDICVKGAGWNIDNKSIEELKIEDSAPFTKLYINRLDISKGNKRQIMLYWYIFKKFGSNDRVTMIRVSKTIRNNETEKTFDVTKQFIERQLFNAMYERTKDDTTIGEYILERIGF